MEEERVDHIDAAGNVIGVVTREEMRAHRLRHRAVFVAVCSTDGRLLVHRRSPTKDLWPGQWDLAVGGVVLAGEDWATAVAREVAEEIGVVIGGATVAEPIGSGDLAYDDSDVSLVGRVYRVRHDGPFRFDDGEVVEALFVGRDDLEARLAGDPFLPDSRALVLPLVRPLLGW